MGLPDGGISVGDASVTTCGASVMDGADCVNGTDLACQTSGGDFCICQGGNWNCF